MAEYEKITQVFEPVYNEDSEILILGSITLYQSCQCCLFCGTVTG